jgi:hypothetical protein
MSVLAAGIAWVLLRSAPRLGTPALALYVGLAVAYYVTIQRDFIDAWQLQRTFWQQVVACCSDFSDGTVMLYTLSSAEEPRFIFANSWADPLVLGEAFAFPTTWANPPRLFSLTEWQSRVSVGSDGKLEWWVPGASWDEHWEPLPEDNVILLDRGQDGTLHRETGSIPIAGTTLRLKPVDPPTAVAPAQLYQALFR